MVIVGLCSVIIMCVSTGIIGHGATLFASHVDHVQVDYIESTCSAVSVMYVSQIPCTFSHTSTRIQALDAAHALSTPMSLSLLSSSSSCWLLYWEVDVEEPLSKTLIYVKPWIMQDGDPSNITRVNAYAKDWLDGHQHRLCWFQFQQEDRVQLTFAQPPPTHSPIPSSAVGTVVCGTMGLILSVCMLIAYVYLSYKTSTFSYTTL